MNLYKMLQQVLRIYEIDPKILGCKPQPKKLYRSSRLKTVPWEIFCCIVLKVLLNLQQ
jgi:hypothetical protein